MNSNLSLIVIDNGPMDGLTYFLYENRPEQLLGRSDISELCYPFDKKMSKQHAKVIFSSIKYSWYIVDLNSEWGIWLDGIKLDPGKYYEIKENQVLLTGSTIIKVSKTFKEISNVDNSYETFFKNPVLTYNFSEQLTEAWNKTLQKRNILNFCNLNSLVESLIIQKFEKTYQSYQCLTEISGNNQNQSLPEWLRVIRTDPVYNCKSFDFITSPKIWCILQRVSENNSDPIEIIDILKIVMNEPSPISECLKNDKAFLMDYKIMIRTGRDLEPEQLEKYYLDRLRQILSGFIQDTVHPDYMERQFSPFSSTDYASIEETFISILKIYETTAYDVQKTIIGNISNIISRMIHHRPGRKVVKAIETIDSFLKQLNDETNIEVIIRNKISNSINNSNI